MRATAIKNGKPVISEKVFQEQVRKAAILTGWRYYHTFNSFRSPSGFPDCVLVRGERLIFAELKSDKGKVTPEQQEWITALKAARCEAYILRPSDFDWFWEELKRDRRENFLTK